MCSSLLLQFDPLDSIFPANVLWGCEALLGCANTELIIHLTGDSQHYFPMIPIESSLWGTCTLTIPTRVQSNNKGQQDYSVTPAKLGSVLFTLLQLSSYLWWVSELDIEECVICFLHFITKPHHCTIHYDKRPHLESHEPESYGRPLPSNFPFLSNSQRRLEWKLSFELRCVLHLHLSHLADALIQSDLQIGLSS
jgi:hypothetical protein